MPLWTKQTAQKHFGLSTIMWNGLKLPLLHTKPRSTTFGQWSSSIDLFSSQIGKRLGKLIHTLLSRPNATLQLSKVHGDLHPGKRFELLLPSLFFFLLKTLQYYALLQYIKLYKYIVYSTRMYSYCIYVINCHFILQYFTGNILWRQPPDGGPVRLSLPSVSTVSCSVRCRFPLRCSSSSWIVVSWLPGAWKLFEVATIFIKMIWYDICNYIITEYNWLYLITHFLLWRSLNQAVLWCYWMTLVAPQDLSGDAGEDLSMMVKVGLVKAAHLRFAKFHTMDHGQAFLTKSEEEVANRS